MPPNSNICPVCAGIPGSLPRLNGRAVEAAVMIAMSLSCEVPERVAFFRKNYFYPDLPKNFQITQLDIYGPASVGGPGHSTADGKRIGITRVQLEEDPGRLVYEGRDRSALVDYNRAGVPLVEIVTEPDFESPGQVRAFLNELSTMLENLKVSDPDLEGAMRADANVSIEGGSKVEIKNIGSFHDLEKAVRFETTRQETLHSKGIDIMQETRHWDERRRITIPSRSKEEAADYRYFLEGDIPWVVISRNILDGLRSKMPETPAARKERYASYGIPGQVADVLSSDRFYSDLFEGARSDSNARHLANMIANDLMGFADTREKRDMLARAAKEIGEMADAVRSGRMSRTSAKSALHEMVNGDRAIPQASSGAGLETVSDRDELAAIVADILSKEEKAADEARTNPRALNYLLGAVMKRTRGRADPKVSMEILRAELGI